MTAHNLAPKPQHPIIAHWRADRNLLWLKDQYGRTSQVAAEKWGIDPQAPMSEPQSFNLSLSFLEHLRVSDPQFFEDFDYNWALDRDSYLDGGPDDFSTAAMNVRLQLEVLRTLVKRNKAVPGVVPSTGLIPPVICARYILSSDLSPACKISNGFGYVFVPFGFKRFTLELLVALSNLVADRQDTPSKIFAALCLPLSASSITNFSIPFFARQIARNYSYDFLTQEAATSFLMKEGPFAGRSIRLGELGHKSLPSALDALLSSAAVNHELGHLVRRHGGSRLLENEIWADVTGLDLSVMTWGWHAETGRVSGLPDPIWTLIGPILLFWAIECIVRLESFDSKETDRECRLRDLAERKKCVDERMNVILKEVWPTFGIKAPDWAIADLFSFKQNLEKLALSFDTTPENLAKMQIGRRALSLA